MAKAVRNLRKAKELSAKAFAARYGKTADWTYKVEKGITPISPKIASDLEKISGVNRLCWLYPGEFLNPYAEDAAA